MKLSRPAVRAYRDAVEAVHFGKRVGTHLYVHRCGLDQLPAALRSLARLADETAGAQKFSYDVLKFGVREPGLSLLSYPGFMDDPFPVLAASAKVDLNDHTLTFRDYSKHKNRPVLHRKEFMLPPGHPLIAAASELTSTAEKYGLFDSPNRIGTEQGWTEILEEAGVELRAGKLVRVGLDPSPEDCSFSEVHRHRTAMARNRLSVPFQLLGKFDYLAPSLTVLDYGCGRGDDVRALTDSGVEAVGWDPHFFPDQQLQKRDVVNLGYVLNVIEDRDERDQTLRQAFALAGSILCVSVLTGSPEYEVDAEPYKDGVRTGAGTFQKYFHPDEFQNYVRAVLGAPCAAISQSTVLAFKSQDELEKFRAKRAGLRREGPRGSTRRASELYVFDEGARETLDAFWEQCKVLGREPLTSELEELSDVGRLGLSPGAAFRFLIEKLGPDDLRPALSQRIEELLVEFALAHFDGRIFFKYLDQAVQRDVEAFFESYSDLRTKARDLLFSIADTAAILNACQEAAADGLGYLLGDHSLQLHVSLIDRLPPVLRVFEGSAERLLGGRGRADLVKLHVASGKVSYLTYDDFAREPVPNLIERIKVDLPKRKIEYFDYLGPFPPVPLLMKSLFLDESFAGYERQAKFDSEILNSGLCDGNMTYRSRQDLEMALTARGLRIHGYSLTSQVYD